MRIPPSHKPKRRSAPDLRLYFSDHFGVKRRTLERYGALDISLVADLPLFIDPFLLFNSRRPVYRTLHKRIIQYLVFLRDKAADGSLEQPLIDSWYRFKEVKETWLGFSQSGNRGAGLGKDFANALHSNLNTLFGDFGNERRITRSSHLEKLCLVQDRVGRDKISDFTTCLILAYLCEYTERFTKQHVDRRLRKRFSVPRVRFDHRTEAWRPGVYTLPRYGSSYVILTPRDLLTREETWINKTDLVDNFEEIPLSIANAQLRQLVNNYFKQLLQANIRSRPGRRPRQPSQAERRAAALRTLQHFPELIDYYIRLKEDTGAKATSVSAERVEEAIDIFLRQLGPFLKTLRDETQFYKIPATTYDEALERLRYLKHAIEERGGWRIFYHKGQPIEREQDIQVMYGLVWCGTISDVNPEADSGRGPVDFTVSRGAADKSLVEFKLATNTQLRRNLAKQVDVYKKSSRAQRTIKAIVYFTVRQLQRVERILKDLGLAGRPDVVLINARHDDKPSGSKA